MRTPFKTLVSGAVTALALSGCASINNLTTMADKLINPLDPHFAPLYDAGSNLNGWTQVGDANWRIQDGSLQADLLSSKVPSYLVSKKLYADYQIYAEFWVDSDTNSGIFIRCQDPLKIGADNCYEVNIWDTRPDPTYGTGAIVDVAKVIPMPKAGGQWNTFEITAKGSQLTVKLNGQTTADVADKKWARGHIALQYGSGIVKFRRVMIRPL
jgi:hypothetical protein